MHMSEVGDDGNEMIKQLKEKFHETEEKSVKVQILTLLSMSWSIKKIENEFKASNYMVRKAKSSLYSVNYWRWKILTNYLSGYN